MKAEAVIRGLLNEAGIEVGGVHPWDIQVHDQRLYGRILAHGTLGLGEAYMDGWWDCEALDRFFFHALSAHIGEKLSISPETIWLWLSSRIFNRQSRSRAEKVAEVHYDLGLDIFEATFDHRLTGSCAYWKEAQDIDAAQEAKLDLICRKIGLKFGQEVLDIGSGWGAFMGFAAERYGARCFGVTVSREQVDYARSRYAGLPVEFQLRDYRDLSGVYDHIVSMGMFEHVGPRNYRAYFEIAHRALKEGGLFLLHTIWGNRPGRSIEPWLDKYIFPNGALPAPSQIAAEVEGLFVIEDVENFGAYYDRTLMAWRNRFAGNRAKIAVRHGERFCRMWDYYLLSCAGGFRSRQINVGQWVLSPRGTPGGWSRPA